MKVTAEGVFVAKEYYIKKDNTRTLQVSIQSGMDNLKFFIDKNIDEIELYKLAEFTLDFKQKMNSSDYYVVLNDFTYKNDKK